MFEEFFASLKQSVGMEQSPVDPEAHWAIVMMPPNQWDKDAQIVMIQSGQKDESRFVNSSMLHILSNFEATETEIKPTVSPYLHLTFECVPWSIDNQLGGWIWIDENGKGKDLPVSARLDKRHFPSRVMDTLCGPLIFGGMEILEGDDIGECRWLTYVEAMTLFDHLHQRLPCQSLGGLWLKGVCDRDARELSSFQPFIS